ncbi:hypothetical protein RV12_GL002180 [Enterococcus quebecensis]|nr:hypothetical protein RV12_GL002180 [Enterococcus quebecensis]
MLLTSFGSNFSLLATAQEQEAGKIELKMVKNELIASDSFKLGQDNYVTGSVDKTIKKVELHVNGVSVSKGKIYIEENFNTFEIAAEQVIKNLDDKVEVVGLTSRGKELARQTVSIEKAEIILTANDFTLHDEEITGVAGNKMDEVSLLIDGEIIDTVKVESDQTYVMPIEEDDIRTVEDQVEVVGSTLGKELGRVSVAINPLGLDGIIPDYILGQVNKVTGELTGKDLAKAKKVRLFVNKKRYTEAMINPDGTFELDATVFITDIKDNVQVSVVNEKDNEIGRYQVKVVTNETIEKKAINEWFPDPVMAQLIADKLGKQPTNIVEKDIFLGITEFSFRAKVYDLEGMQHLKKLRYLNYYGSGESLREVSDISKLSNLTSLVWLDLLDAPISDVRPLRNLYNLETLLLDGNKISDISSLSNLKSLRALRISNNQIKDISVLRNFTKLKEINFSDNQISDVSPLKKLERLESADFSNNQISDISFLDSLPIIFPNFYGQKITLPKQKLSAGNRLELTSPVQISKLINISDNGSYTAETNRLTWENLKDSGEVSYEFNGKLNWRFYGTVTIPYEK